MHLSVLKVGLRRQEALLDCGDVYESSPRCHRASRPLTSTSVREVSDALISAHRCQLTGIVEQECVHLSLSTFCGSCITSLLIPVLGFIIGEIHGRMLITLGIRRHRPQWQQTMPSVKSLFMYDIDNEDGIRRPKQGGDEHEELDSISLGVMQLFRSPESVPSQSPINHYASRAAQSLQLTKREAQHLEGAVKQVEMPRRSFKGRAQGYGSQSTNELSGVRSDMMAFLHAQSLAPRYVRQSKPVAQGQHLTHPLHLHPSLLLCRRASAL